MFIVSVSVTGEHNRTILQKVDYLEPQTHVLQTRLDSEYNDRRRFLILVLKISDNLSVNDEHTLHL